MKEYSHKFVMNIDDEKKWFSDIYEEESDSLFRFCLIRTSDRERALELTQESFARMWQAVVAEKPIDNPKAYLYVVARHLIIDWYRKHKSVSLERIVARTEDEDGTPPLEVPDAEAMRQMEVDADASRALDALREIEPQYREVIFLRFFEGMQPHEIADIMGVNSNIVSIRITRGLEALRRAMHLPDKKDGR
jgi:RNA polymerase sigma-70 factor (ECF subfamily)